MFFRYRHKNSSGKAIHSGYCHECTQQSERRYISNQESSLLYQTLLQRVETQGNKTQQSETQKFMEAIDNGTDYDMDYILIIL